MVLVGYSDSEESDAETSPAPAPVVSSKPTSTAAGKQHIQKLVDKSNPHKIRVNLPSFSEPAARNDDERPAKKPRLGGRGGGLLSDLNSFLPAPKRSGAESTESSSIEKNGTNGEKKKLGKGRPLGSGISLKTGAAPAFSREPVMDETDDWDNDMAAEKPPKPEDIKLVGKATIFKPLSVAKKAKKKINTNPTAAAIAATKDAANVSPSNTSRTTVPSVTAAKPKAKVSLFSMSQDTTYEPVLPEAEDETQTAPLEQEDEAALYDHMPSHEQPMQKLPSTTQKHSLSDIASTMNLDAASRRQLLGRHAKGPDAVQVLHFDTDVEYAANERLRESGETVQHNPLKSIQPGRHTLRQLVSAAVTQKDALEQKWAEGKAKQGDTANRYGWR